MLRAADDIDRDFLRDLYASTRDDISHLPWPDEQRRQFIDMQFAAQQADYEMRFPNAEHSIVLVGGEKVGRIWINRRNDEIRLLDIALLPDARNRGTGRVLVERLIAEAQAAHKPLRHSVYRENVGALRFYRGLGFQVVEDFELYVLMEWRE